MFLGRSTIQWTALISALAGTVQVMLVALVPDVDAALVATVIGAIVLALGSVIAFIANTSTTPSADPQLKAGTMIRVTDDAGTVIGHTPVPDPGPPPAPPG
jgi:hypothetical protein